MLLMSQPKWKSLLVIVVFVLVLILPVAYMLIRNYFFKG